MKIRRLFYTGSILLISLVALLFLLDYTKYGLITLVLTSLYIIYYLVADYQFIIFNSAENEVSINYSKVISFGSSSPSSIVFPKHLYHSSTFENSFWGRLTDLTITVQLEKGLADYPTISLTAMPLSARENIQSELNKLVR